MVYGPMCTRDKQSVEDHTKDSSHLFSQVFHLQPGKATLLSDMAVSVCPHLLFWLTSINNYSNLISRTKFCSFFRFLSAWSVDPRNGLQDFY